MEYKFVPNMISCKDLDYLSDMFNWNYGAYKMIVNLEVMDEEIKSVFNKASEIFLNNMKEILNILEGEINGN